MNAKHVNEYKSFEQAEYASMYYAKFGIYAVQAGTKVYIFGTLREALEAM